MREFLSGCSGEVFDVLLLLLQSDDHFEPFRYPIPYFDFWRVLWMIACKYFNSMTLIQFTL
uniref:Bm1090 n=1 Tax=Brugia malayi TaxID=6279 RepID=A0A1I9G6H2_BRUMA|nr:Bm1090 [Brugia malayi]